MIDGRGGLSIAVLIFYGLGLLPAVYLCIRHGFGRHAGWLYLVTLPIVRIVGASCQIAAEQNPSVGLYTAAAICNGIGLVPLLLTLMGILKRVNDGMTTHLPVRVFQLAHLVTLVGLALSIAGGVDSIPTNDASTISNGVTYRKVGSVLLLIVYIANAGIVAITILRLSKVWTGDRKLIFAAAASLPFLLVRVIYTMCIAFAYHTKTFNSQAPDVYAQAFMQIVMEFIAWSLFLAAGLASPSTKEAPHARGQGQEIWPLTAQRGTQQVAHGRPQY